MPEIWEQLEKIDDYRFRLPKSARAGMRVDGIIYADENLLTDIRKDKALEQVANVAFLPGIVNASLAMPDIHWGYGFPIGGVAATDPENSGVVSPGGVGFDINCLSATTFILNELGYKKKIKDFEKDFSVQTLKCMSFFAEKEEVTKIAGFMKQKPKNTVLNIVTDTGRQIAATEDHPFYTKDGMKPLGRIKLGEEVAAYPFEGVEYEEPSAEVLVTREDVRKILCALGVSSRGNALIQILNYLDTKEILPLRYDSPQLPYLLKIIGYCFGDGTLYFENKIGKGTACFYGNKEDLLKIKVDIEKIGFQGSIYSRQRHHKIKTVYSICEFQRREDWLKVPSSGFAALLVALGMPIGNKCRQPYDIPKCLLRAPLWQKRLFLASFFGAEMSAPKTMTDRGYNFYCPTVSMNKTLDCIENGKKFLEDISSMLSEFGVTAHRISQRKEYVNAQGIVSYRLRLMIANTNKNLINLYCKIGFEYNEKRKFLANAAIGYLGLKNRILNERKDVIVVAPELKYQKNWISEDIYSYLSTEYISERFIKRCLYESKNRKPRMWGNDFTFEQYLKKATEGIGQSGMIWEKIEHISDIEYDGYVYDFTVTHPDHNFIADGFVVSNCGVRLVKTSLRYEEIRDKIEELTVKLFNLIPSGLGSKGEIRASEKDEKQIMLKGSGWAVSKGYGTAEDLEATEENGAIAGADPDAVSERAYERGKAQSGTLGSGNHFLEVQVIDQIYDADTADAFGLEEGQVTLMIHSGSRGFGYQICDDYVKSMLSCPGKYGINIPDRQLACAPVNSPEAKRYLGAMRAAANYAWNNRQCLMHLARQAFEKVFNMSWQKMGMDLIYDVAHNIAKLERHKVHGQEKLLCVHRKGATRAFPPGHPELPLKYRKTGQPVIIPGDMGRNSYLLVGTEKAAETFYSTCHGAGRVKSRTAAAKAFDANKIISELKAKGIYVMASGRGTIVEEAPLAYKDINQVVDVVEGAGISKKVCRMRPIGVVKG